MSFKKSVIQRRVHAFAGIKYSTTSRVLPQANSSSEAVFGRENTGSGFFQRCLAKKRGSTPEERRFWRDGIYEQIREVMPLRGSLGIERMCACGPGRWSLLMQEEGFEPEVICSPVIRKTGTRVPASGVTGNILVTRHLQYNPTSIEQSSKSRTVWCERCPRQRG